MTFLFEDVFYPVLGVIAVIIGFAVVCHGVFPGGGITRYFKMIRCDILRSSCLDCPERDSCNVIKQLTKNPVSQERNFKY